MDPIPTDDIHNHHSIDLGAPQRRERRSRHVIAPALMAVVAGVFCFAAYSIGVDNGRRDAASLAAMSPPSQRDLLYVGTTFAADGKFGWCFVAASKGIWVPGRTGNAASMICRMPANGRRITADMHDCDIGGGIAVAAIAFSIAGYCIAKLYIAYLRDAKGLKETDRKPP